MFDALERAVETARKCAQRGETIVVVLRSHGNAFCAGFDLNQCVCDPSLLASFVDRLGKLATSLRTLPAVVVARVHGPALAGGCALVAACDIVCASESATFGYPVHRIGISPAVSLPTLMATSGLGGARALTMSGEIVNARRARELGLVHFIATDEQSLHQLESDITESLIKKGPTALRATKQWLNEVDGTAPDGALGRRAFDATNATIALTREPEATSLLNEFWKSRNDRKGST